MKTATVGVVCLARTTFDYKTAAIIYENTAEFLKEDVSVNWIINEGLVIEPEDAKKAGAFLGATQLDGLVIISGTFHLGHLALIINDCVKKPVLLWALSELPYNGGKIRLNSVCGVNLNSSNLYKAGVDGVCCHVGDYIDSAWLDAVKMKAALAGAHVGVAGYRADGFFNLSVCDTELYKNTGLLIDHYELNDLMGAFKAEGSGCSEQEVREIYDCCALSDEQVQKVAGLSEYIEAFMDKKCLDALAIRCWPEFAATYGIAPCAAMSLLAGKGRILGCEGDVEGTASMLAWSAICDEPPFLADLSQLDFDNDYALMWHCGVAAHTLWDKHSSRTLDTYFAAGKGVTAGFVMKGGVVTVMRIDTARGKTRLFVQRGMAVPMEKELTGTYCRVRFEKPVNELFKTVTETGIAHHVAMIYGDKLVAAECFAKIMGFELIK